MTGIFLHDVGKIDELSYDRAFAYTDEGQLVGHLVMGVEMLGQKVARCTELTGEPFPAELLLRLKHMIVSHHGSYEFGSPKLPMTLEAVALHYLDNLDAKLHTFSREIRDDPSRDSSWTPFQQSLGRRLFKGTPQADGNGDPTAPSLKNGRAGSARSESHHDRDPERGNAMAEFASAGRGARGRAGLPADDAQGACRVSSTWNRLITRIFAEMVKDLIRDGKLHAARDKTLRLPDRSGMIVGLFQPLGQRIRVRSPSPCRPRDRPGVHPARSHATTLRAATKSPSRSPVRRGAAGRAPRDGLSKS